MCDSKSPIPSRTPAAASRIRCRRRIVGATLIEVMITIVIFTLFIGMYSATFPPVIRSTGHAANHLKASELARHKLEQARRAGYTKLNKDAMFDELKMIDSKTANADNSFSFTNTDGLVNTGTGSTAKVGYFGASTNATGTIAIGPPSLGASSPPETSARQVTVTITWKGGGTPPGRYVTQTVIVAP